MRNERRECRKEKRQRAISEIDHCPLHTMTSAAVQSASAGLLSEKVLKMLPHRKGWAAPLYRAKHDPAGAQVLSMSTYIHIHGTYFTETSH